MNPVERADGHPSYLELDRHALGCATDALATREHVLRCAQCQRYVAALAPAGAVPLWVAQLKAAPVRSSRRRMMWPAAALGLAAAAASVLLFMPAAHDRSAPYIGVKGSPSVAVYVNHADRVELWHGEALAPGDRIRLEVAPEAFEHVSVFAEEPDKSTLLYQGKVSAHARSVLPKAWQLDDKSAAEHLAVVFSARPLREEQARAQLTAAGSARVHVVKIQLSKRLP